MNADFLSYTRKSLEDYMNDTYIGSAVNTSLLLSRLKKHLTNGLPEDMQNRISLETDGRFFDIKYNDVVLCSIHASMHRADVNRYTRFDCSELVEGFLTFQGAIDWLDKKFQDILTPGIVEKYEETLAKLVPEISKALAVNGKRASSWDIIKFLRYIDKLDYDSIVLKNNI